MHNVQLLDRHFEPFLPAEEIAQAVHRVAEQINEDYEGKEVLFVAVLNGAFMFAADLLRHLTIPCQISFVRVSSYEGTQSTGQVTQVLGLNQSVEDRHVIVLEDILDTGRTMQELEALLRTEQPASLEFACAFSKPECLQHEVRVKYTGLQLANVFVVGYGLDYQGYGRELADLYQVVDAEPEG